MLDVATLRRLARYIYTTSFDNLKERMSATNCDELGVGPEQVWSRFNAIYDALRPDARLDDQMLLSLAVRLLPNEPETIGEPVIDIPTIDLNTLADQIKSAKNFHKAMDVLFNHIGREAFLHFENLQIRSRHMQIDAELKDRGLPSQKTVTEPLADELVKPIQGRPPIDVLFEDENSPVDKPRDYTAKRPCPHCGTVTAHSIHHGANHERDSSGDWAQCGKCGARWMGLTGKYGPPEKAQPK